MIKPQHLLFIGVFLLQMPISVCGYDDDYYADDYSDDGYYQTASEDNYYYSDADDDYYPPTNKKNSRKYSNKRAVDLDDQSYSRLPQQISPPGEKTIIIDPHVHAWGAYSANGELLRSGISTAGARWCNDIERPCRTSVGSFRIYSLGSFNCISHKFPLGRGGAPMPYCMFFNGGQGLHGSYQVVDGNVSHGCVRMHVDDAEWLRFNFATIGTKVVVKPY